MTSEKSSAHKTGSILQELPTVDWLDLARNREKFLNDLRYALSDCGFLVLTNAPGLDDDFQQRAFREVRGFFDAPMDIKKTAHISNTPYFRGYTLPTPADRGHGQVIENFQYGFCLLYPSDAADDSLRVNRGGRRTMKHNNHNHKM